MERYLTSVVNFGEVWRTQLAECTFLTSTLVPWDLFRSFKVCSDAKEREWGAVNNGKLPYLFIPGKIAALVPEFAVEDLPSAELKPRFLFLQWRTCPWAKLWYDVCWLNTNCLQTSLKWILLEITKYWCFVINLLGPIYYSTKSSLRSENMRPNRTTHSTCHSQPSLFT